MLRWMELEGTEFTNSTDRNIFVGIQSANSLTLLFDRIQPSHNGEYTCLATLRDELTSINMSARATSSVMNISENNYLHAFWY